MATVKPALNGKSLHNRGKPGEYSWSPAGLGIRTLLHGRKSLAIRLRGMGKAHRRDRQRKGRHDLPPGRHRSPQELVADRHQYRRQQIFPRQAQHCRARNSVRQLIGRVVNTIVRWGQDGGYFADNASRDAFRDELTHLLVEQKMASIRRSGSTSACSPSRSARPASSTPSQDTMESIMGLTAPKACSSSGAPAPAPTSPRSRQPGNALRRRHRLRPGQLHEGLRRLCWRHQERWQDAPRRQDGHPQHRSSRHR